MCSGKVGLIHRLSFINTILNQRSSLANYAASERGTRGAKQQRAGCEKQPSTAQLECVGNEARLEAHFEEVEQQEVQRRWPVGAVEGAGRDLTKQHADRGRHDIIDGQRAEGQRNLRAGQAYFSQRLA